VILTSYRGWDAQKGLQKDYDLKLIIEDEGMRQFFETAVLMGAKSVNVWSDKASVWWTLNTYYTDRLLLNTDYSASVLPSFQYNSQFPNHVLVSVSNSDLSHSRCTSYLTLSPFITFNEPCNVE